MKHRILTLAMMALVSSSPAIANSPPDGGIKSLTLTSDATSGGRYTIYANGKMQAKLTVTYELTKGVIDPKITIKEKGSSSDELPAGWKESTQDNGFHKLISSHGSGYSSVNMAAPSNLADKKNVVVKHRYISGTGHNDTITLCVELKALDSNMNEISDSTCINQRNHDTVTVAKVAPIKYSADDFRAVEGSRTEDNDVSARYYEITPLGGALYRNFNVIGLHTGTPDSSGRKWESLPGTDIYKADRGDGKALFGVFLNERTTKLKSNDALGETSWTLDTQTRDNSAVLKLALVYSPDLKSTSTSCVRWISGRFGPLCAEFKDYSTYRWPLPDRDMEKLVKQVVLVDDYGTEHVIPFSINGWDVYIGANHIW